MSGRSSLRFFHRPIVRSSNWRDKAASPASQTAARQQVQDGYLIAPYLSVICLPRDLDPPLPPIAFSASPIQRAFCLPYIDCIFFPFLVTYNQLLQYHQYHHSVSSLAIPCVLHPVRHRIVCSFQRALPSRYSLNQGTRTSVLSP